MLSPRFDAALADLAGRLALRGFSTDQEIRRVAAIYSDSVEEYETLVRMLVSNLGR